MDRPRTPRRRPEAPSAPTTLTEITRRYYATALALAKAMGLPLSEDFLRQHRESISCCFIEAGRAGVRLPSAVSLPPLTQAPVSVTTAPPLNGSDHAEPVTDGVTTVTAPNGDAVLLRQDRPPANPSTNSAVAVDATVVASPTTIPTGWPSGGQAIAALKPAALHMLISKTAALMHGAERDRWVGLMAALQSERAARMARGRKRPVEG